MTSPTADALAIWLEAARTDPAGLGVTVARLRRPTWPGSEPLCGGPALIERRKERGRWVYRISRKWDRVPPWRGGSAAREPRKPLPGRRSFLES